MLGKEHETRGILGRSLPVRFMEAKGPGIEPGLIQKSQIQSGPSFDADAIHSRRTLVSTTGLKQRNPHLNQLCRTQTDTLD